MTTDLETKSLLDLPDNVSVHIRPRSLYLELVIFVKGGQNWLTLRTISWSFLSDHEHDKEATRFFIQHTLAVLEQTYYRRFVEG